MGNTEESLKIAKRRIPSVMNIYFSRNKIRPPEIRSATRYIFEFAYGRTVDL